MVRDNTHTYFQNADPYEAKINIALLDIVPVTPTIRTSNAMSQRNYVFREDFSDEGNRWINPKTVRIFKWIH